MELPCRWIQIVSTSLLTLLLLNVVYPYWGALRKHGIIREHYLAGRITASRGGEPMNDLLEVADNSMNEGLRNSTFLFGLLMLVIYFQRHLWK